MFFVILSLSLSLSLSLLSLSLSLSPKKIVCIGFCFIIALFVWCDVLDRN